MKETNWNGSTVM